VSLDLTGLTDAQLRVFAVRCARRVQHLMTDPRSVAALDVAERHARGEATDAELTAAREAAWNAARAAWEAARVAAWYAAWYAACDAAGAAASAAACDAAGAAASNGDWQQAYDAERAEQQRILDDIRKEVGP
jgi:hypothetical protein